MHRKAPRLARILACAAVPVMLVVTGCSSDSGDKSGDTGAAQEKGGDKAAESAAPPAEKTPDVEPAKFAKLPDACRSVPAKTVGELVPSAKVKGGTAGRSTDTMSRSNCSWNGLDDNGVEGSQYRWLDVSYLRYDSEQALAASGAQRAQDNFTKELSKAQSTPGAKKVKSAAAKGIGEQASTVTYQLRKTGEDFSYVTVVARTENVVITLTYNGTGYAGAQPPAVADLTEKALGAAKESVASVKAANK
ncbi:DUF3558 domain-containing protein [Streptomyces jumonjinensis]|uniref:DUF3558 domain-containing protein n=1 Tax=Streptomyces jumonjinensis TaxID=1945 RepID=A0A646KKX5_STRJU|nr:DUF3558 domain-containing protein [Streptomyces jumonjinensis]MQT02952.1 DUF3558 domain-containing protein [Streptomyces jumonjinensis]